MGFLVKHQASLPGSISKRRRVLTVLDSISCNDKSEANARSYCADNWYKMKLRSHSTNSNVRKL